MISINTIDHMNIQVQNLEESKKFYSDVFGFSLKEEGVSTMTGKPYAIIGQSGKLLLALVESSDRLHETRLNHFGINVPDFDKAIEVIKELKVPTGEYGDVDGVVEYPNSRSIYVIDPDGNEIELSSKFGGGL